MDECWYHIFNNLGIEHDFRGEFRSKVEYFIEIFGYWLNGYMDSFIIDDYWLLEHISRHTYINKNNVLQWTYCVITLMVIIYKTELHFSLRVLQNFLGYPEFEGDVVAMTYDGHVGKIIYEYIKKSI